jgi:hypothetical protein
MYGNSTSREYKSHGDLFSLTNKNANTKQISKTLSYDNFSPITQDIEMGTFCSNDKLISNDVNDINCDEISSSIDEVQYSSPCSMQNFFQNIKRCIKNPCSNKQKYVEMVIHHYTHLLMFVILEILFYFNYVVKYEKQTVFQMIEDLKEEIVDMYDIDISPYKNCEYLDDICNNFVDNSTNKANTEIYNNALYLIIAMSGFLMLLIVIETNMFKKCSVFPKEFTSSLLLMSVVGIFEYLFFSYFIIKYKIVDKSEVICYLYEHDDGGCAD